MSEVQRKRLQELRFESANFVVVVLIIGKTTPREFNSKSTSGPRAVLTFTVRDSKQFFTNCVCWGTVSKLEEYNRKYLIGDVVDIITPQVTPISQSSRQFHPQTSTPYALSVNEGAASIEPHMFDTALSKEIASLRNQPAKPINLALNLADVNSGGASTNGQFVDLLVVVRMCRAIRTIKSKNTGEDMRCLEVIVSDRSYPGGMSFSMWHEEWIERAARDWTAGRTVLHLIDAKVDYSAFYKRNVITFSSKTIIVQDPAVKEARQLVEFASTLDSLDLVQQGVPEPNSITTTMSVQQIYDRCEGIVRDDSEQFTAALYAVVTLFDLDGLSRCVSKKCKYCKRLVPLRLSACSNDQCQMDISFGSSGQNSFDHYYDINIHLTDHTGTLTECRLLNNYAEDILGCSVEQFQRFNNAARTERKWKFLMERVCAKLVVKKRSATRMNLFVMIVDMKTMSLDDVAESILVY